MTARVLAAAIAMAVILGASGCRVEFDTSLTPKPNCAAGQTAQRMPSHQHYMWTCAPGGPAS